MDPRKSPKGSSLKLSLRNSLLLLLLTATDAVVARRTNEPSNIHEKNTYNTNLRHSNLIEQQFQRRVKNKKKKKDKDEYEDEIEDEDEYEDKDKEEDEYEDEDNDDCSIELTRDGMSPADVKRSSVAAKLSYLAYKLDEFPEFDEEPAYDELFYGQDERGVFYESGIDAVYTTRIRKEFCVAVFRGTEQNRDDWDSNFEIDAVEFEMENASEKDKKASTDAVCDVRSGYHDSYSNFKYRSGVESFLQTCSEECPECDIVLTGHSQGGGIAEVAALYYKRLTASNPKKFYVITFGAPHAIGAGCLPMFAKEERCGFYRYIMTMEGAFGRGLIYDPIPMITANVLGDSENDGIVDEESSFVSDSFARHGGIAFLGHELFLNADEPSSVALGAFDGHHGVGTSKYDMTTDAHGIKHYMSVLEEQSERFPSNDDEYGCYLPTNGFCLGSLCNTDESNLHCADGVSECKRNGWWWGSENTCQAIGGSSTTQSAAWDRFCHKRPLEWTYLP